MPPTITTHSIRNRGEGVEEIENVCECWWVYVCMCVYSMIAGGW